MHISDWLPTLVSAAAGTEVAKTMKHIDGLVKGSYYNETFDGWYDKNGKLIKGLLPAEPKARLKLYKRTYLKYLKRSKVARTLWRKYAKDPRLAISCHTPGCQTFPIVKCSHVIPPSESTCKPKEAPCLFDIDDDPCEYFNIAEQYPEVVEQLQFAINRYRTAEKPPGGQPPDLAADPKLHGNVWKPWK
ncbi:hypothetical protein CDAR_546921 [Caerostris darwini]|uniref:Uncharacterized protein n=1 Tax=Caerostris darwini TaxID=1538125 RepID=A0AAV4WBG8_9ARAC|nr:hypothetical protein CDAR_546921 [Caerostris darwini]